MIGQRARMAVAALVVLAGLGLALVASRSGTQFIDPPPTPGVTIAPPPPVLTKTGANYDPSRSLPSDIHPLAGIYIVIGVALLLIALGGIPLILPKRIGRGWLRRRYRVRYAPPEPVRRGAPQLLAEAVERALATLDTGEVGDAIVGCWVALERAAAAAGTQRLAAETSTELTERVLAEHQVSPETLRQLAVLYREARYSGHALGEPERATARALFEQVRAELRVPA